MRYNKKFTALLLAAAMVLPSGLCVQAASFTDGSAETNGMPVALAPDFSAAEGSSDPETTPVPEITPDPGITPTPEITPGPDITPTPDITPAPDITPTPAPTVKAKWIKKNGRYYWRQSNGKLLKTPGPVILGGKSYYLYPSGARVADAWKEINGKFYYYQKNGLKYEKSGWYQVGKYRYYLGKGGYRRTGFLKIKGKTYYFNPYGKLYVNKQAIQIDKKYYSIDANGVVTNISEKQAQVSAEAKKFIAKHTTPSMSANQKLHACYRWLVAYLHYRSKPFNAKDFAPADWPYTYALNVFRTQTGNCYNFACTIAAVAKELGYKPYVIVSTGDHGFVQINGLYYDHVGLLFGSSYHPPYNVYKKVLF